MTQTNKASDIGLGQGGQICRMPVRRRREFIAEGLPIIFDSAQSLLRASNALTDFSREARILEGHGNEECAKILILIDIARCPPKLVASRIGPMMRWFYDHLARLIYADAQHWKPASVAQLQQYVDDHRQSHYLEGEYSEYIIPNWALFERESSLYVDVVGSEEAEPTWNSPVQIWNTPFHEWALSGAPDPVPYSIAEALKAFGVFTVAGLKILTEVWGKVDFVDDQDFDTSRALYKKMVERLDSAKLITDRASKDHASTLANNWQMPMYRIDFARVLVSLDELRKRREQESPYQEYYY